MFVNRNLLPEGAAIVASLRHPADDSGWPGALILLPSGRYAWTIGDGAYRTISQSFARRQHARAALESILAASQVAEVLT